MVTMPQKPILPLLGGRFSRIAHVSAHLISRALVLDYLFNVAV